MSFYLVAGTGAATTPTDTLAHARQHLPTSRPRRYPSDTTDNEWALIAPLIPAGGPGRRGGRRPTWSRRDIVDALRYVTDNGIKWRALPADFPPWKTVYHYHHRWATDGTLARLHNSLREQVAPPKAASRTRPRRSSTPNRYEPPKPLPAATAATTPASTSTAANATSPPTPSACYWSLP